jgi:hypothetical protein
MSHWHLASVGFLCAKRYIVKFLGKQRTFHCI